jgi:hypothetical protein
MWLRIVYFWIIAQRVLVISYPRFGTTTIQTDSRLSQYAVYTGTSGGGDKFSVMWCQSIGLMQVVWREGECGIQCSFEKTSSVREEILTRVFERNTRTSM